MWANEMNSANDNSILPTAQDFRCGCSTTRTNFDDNGTTGVYVFNSIILVLTSISATLGNLLILVSIWRTPSLHSPSNVLLFGLAVSDLGVGLVVEPRTLVYYIAKLNGLAHVFCNSVVSLKFTGVLFCFASLFTITALSLDMYIALYLHLRYQEIVTVKRMTGVLFVIWLCSITASLLYLWYFIRLWILWVSIILLWYMKHLLLLWISLVLLCLLVTPSVYYKVFNIVRHHQGRIDAQAQVEEQAEDQDENSTSIAQNRKALMNKFHVYCSFVICYLPIVVMAVVIDTMDVSVRTTQSIRGISLALVYFNSTLNPFIYCWRFQKIRAAIIETTKKILRRQNAIQ